MTVAFLFGWWGSCSFSVSADDDVHRATPEAELLAGLLSCETAIDLSAYALPVTELGRLYANVLYGYPELFHVALRLSYTSQEVFDAGSGQMLRVVSEVYPSYTLTGEALVTARTRYRETVAGILGEMEMDFGGRSRTDAETALYLHDYLADRYAYDTRREGSSNGAANANAYGFFRDGVGICQAYALAFLALARGAGLEADFVYSDAMDHAWNHVKADGVWYHVDVTRDDPIPAADGREAVEHLRLLRSDAGMKALGYYGFACAAEHTCTDTRFEPEGKAALAEFHDALVPAGNAWIGSVADGAPVAVEIRTEGMRVGGCGDTDGNGEVTPADLLTVYDPIYPEEWRVWLRRKLTKGA